MKSTFLNVRAKVILVLTMLCGLVGCSEWDEFTGDYSVLCVSPYDSSFLLLGEKSRMISMSTDSCDDLLSQLSGVWDGLGGSAGTRFDVDSEGNFTFYQIRKNMLTKSYSGRF